MSRVSRYTSVSAGCFVPQCYVNPLWTVVDGFPMVLWCALVVGFLQNVTRVLFFLLSFVLEFLLDSEEIPVQN